MAALGLATGLGLAACVATVDAPEQSSARDAQPAAEPSDWTAEQAQHGPRRHGPVRFVLETALERAELTADQQLAIQAMIGDLESDGEVRHQLRAQLRASALDVVRAGTANPEQVAHAADEATRALAERMIAGQDALVELHALLDADQRHALAEALRERIDERAERHRAGRHRGRLGRLAEHLMLSRVQIDQLRRLGRTLMGERKQLEPSHEQLLGLVDAFEADGAAFEEALDALRADKLALVQQRASRVGQLANAALSVLSDGQRTLLADVIERGPRRALFDEPR